MIIHLTNSLVGIRIILYFLPLKIMQKLSYPLSYPIIYFGRITESGSTGPEVVHVLGFDVLVLPYCPAGRRLHLHLRPLVGFGHPCFCVPLPARRGISLKKSLSSFTDKNFHFYIVFIKSQINFF